ncbi:MAG: serine/threonine-protein kinase [Polyangiaceae bacterium]
MVAARLLPADPVGRQRVDRYELVGEIASGGMATVFLARRAGVGGFQRFVAIKRLHPHLAEEAEFVEMFLDEARLAALIHHPNVVSITEVGANERGYYLVMDYVEGDTLARLLSIAAERNTVMPIGIGLRVVIDMLTGLHAAHELNDEQGKPLGLVHRDVSPQNVLVGVDGIARLVDFGVARAATRLAGTRAGQLKGKIAYMSPEQAAADESIDRRADVFAAGIVLWEVLTGRRLFKSTNDAATLSRVVTDRIEPPVNVVGGIDSRLSDICMKALERPLARRYQTAAQFADQLEQAASRKGILATGREVTAYIHKVLGSEIQGQREAVRRWIAASDCGNEDSRPSGIPRPERASSPPDSSPSASYLRRIATSRADEPMPGEDTLYGQVPAAEPRARHDDETQVAPPPRLARPRWLRWALLGGLGALGLIGLVAVPLWRASTSATPIAPEHRISILGQVPAVTSPDDSAEERASSERGAAGSSVNLALGGDGVNGAVHREPSEASRGEPSTGVSVARTAGGASGSASGSASGKTSGAGGAAASNLGIAPSNNAASGAPATGNSAKSSRPSNAALPAISDVDLSNPYR